MDPDDNPLGLLIGGTFYFMLLMFAGGLMPWWYVSEWAPHAGLMKPGQLNVATSDVLPWYIGTAVFLSMLLASGYNRLVGRLASLMMLLFAYSVLLPVITATLLILPFNLIGLSNKRIEGFVHLGSIAGWTCYALYIFFAPPPPERRGTPAVPAPSVGRIAPIVQPASSPSAPNDPELTLVHKSGGADSFRTGDDSESGGGGDSGRSASPQLR